MKHPALFLLLTGVCVAMAGNPNTNFVFESKPILMGTATNDYVLRWDTKEFCINTKKGQVHISVVDGKVTADKGVVMDDAAKQFWRGITLAFPEFKK